jgi:uncharacterized membrane protein YccC
MFIRMDENLKFVFTLGAGALGGAIVAGMFAMVGAWIANKREHKQWLRDSKQESYAEFLAAIVEASTTLDPAHEAKQAQRRVTIALSQIRLVGAKEVTAAAVTFGSHVNTMHKHSHDRREMIALDFSANEAGIKAATANIADGIKRIPDLTEAFVGKARMDMGSDFS